MVEHLHGKEGVSGSSPEVGSILCAMNEKSGKRKIAAKVILIDGDGKVLFLRRSASHPKYAIDLPGGIVEPGESMVEGLIREIREECGFEVKEREITRLAEEDYRLTWHYFLGLGRFTGEKPALSWEHGGYLVCGIDETAYNSIFKEVNDPFTLFALRILREKQAEILKWAGAEEKPRPKSG